MDVFFLCRGYGTGPYSKNVVNIQHQNLVKILGFSKSNFKRKIFLSTFCFGGSF